MFVTKLVLLIRNSSYSTGVTVFEKKHQNSQYPIPFIFKEFSLNYWPEICRLLFYFACTAVYIVEYKMTAAMLLGF